MNVSKCAVETPDQSSADSSPEAPGEMYGCKWENRTNHLTYELHTNDPTDKDRDHLQENRLDEWTKYNDQPQEPACGKGI